MTAPTPEKIQRFCFAIDMSQEFCECDMKKEMDGEYVLHSDHLRHLKLAQIEVLEEMNAAMTKQNGGSFCNEESEWSNAKIAALRKELEG